MDKEEILDRIREDYGEDALFTIDDYVETPTQVISTGSFTLDNFVLATGGIPRGRVTMLAGAEGSGKTTLSLHTAAHAQAMGLAVAFIDAEQALDPVYATKLGVDVETLLVSRPQTLPQAWAVIEGLCNIGSVGLIIFDSLPAVGSGEEYNAAKYEDVKSEWGKCAQMHNIFLRRKIYTIRENSIALILINQLRANLAGGFGHARKTILPGGHGLRHFSSIILEFTYTGQIKSGSQVVGQTIKVFTRKNKVKDSFRSADVELYNNRGFDPIGDILIAGHSLGVIQKRGSFYSYGDERIAQGRIKSIEKLEADPELVAMIRQEMEEKWLNE